jgi:hypothetical protein
MIEFAVLVITALKGKFSNGSQKIWKGIPAIV